ncbi:MAG: hypothetical protein M1834_006043 [Cirrosporium novae-zelandiae]|nr:MAG: hypothetical protein M1834_006043 [Cirrosporium novae-zelandiae]
MTHVKEELGRKQEAEKWNLVSQRMEELGVKFKKLVKKVATTPVIILVTAGHDMIWETGGKDAATDWSKDADADAVQRGGYSMLCSPVVDWLWIQTFQSFVDGYDSN